MQAINRRWSVVSRASGYESAETNFELDPFGNSRTEVDPSGHLTMRRYNNQARPVETTLPNGDKIVMEFNAMGQPTRRIDAEGRESLYRYDPHGRLLESVDIRGRIIRHEYDDRGFPVRTHIDEQTCEWEFDDWGRIVAASLDDRHKAYWHYDEKGQLTEMAEHQSGSGIPIVSERYEYDRYGRLIRIDSEPGGSTRFAYNRRGQLTSRMSSDGEQVRYEYNKSGLLKRRLDTASRIDEYRYQPNGRLALHRYRPNNGDWSEKQFDFLGASHIQKSRKRQSHPLRIRHIKSVGWCHTPRWNAGSVRIRCLRRDSRNRDSRCRLMLPGKCIERSGHCRDHNRIKLFEYAFRRHT